MTTTTSSPLTMDLSEQGAGALSLDENGLPTPEAMGMDGVMSADPAKVNAFTATVLAEQDADDPIITGPPDTSVTLLAGYVDETGARNTSVQIRELRGRDEESLAKAVANGDMSRFIDAIVRAGTVRVGDVDDEAGLKNALDSLLIGDRALLCMQIRRLAYGDTMALDVRCPLCDHEFGIEYSFSEDVPLKAFSVEGFDDPATRQYVLTCPSGATVSIRAVDGAAQKKVYTPENVRKKTSEECNTLLLTELISEYNGKPLRGPSLILDQPSKDRRFLLKWVTDNQPGPQYNRVEQDCPECARSFPLGVVDLYQMFRGA